ncbi:Phage integrase family protein [Ruminococcaceae bacterium D5]|nr:Phage integrase family protein [Ruminococcaceae bacterium D5]
MWQYSGNSPTAAMYSTVHRSDFRRVYPCIKPMVSLNRFWMSSILLIFLACSSSRIFALRSFSSGLRFFLPIVKTSDVVLLFYTTSKVYTIVYLTAEEANEVLRAFQGHRLQPLVYITLYYGLRRSEIIGIKWSSLDFQKMTLKIRDVIVKSRTIEEKSRTKTRASKATFDLLPEVRDILLEIKKQQQKFKSFYGNQYHDKDYVFCWDDGTPYRSDYITKAFQAQLKKSGLPKMKFHSLRHSCASVLYDKGWELKDIQEWLRHTKIETTGDIYVHISKNRKKIMGENLSGTFHL